MRKLGLEFAFKLHAISAFVVRFPERCDFKGRQHVVELAMRVALQHYVPQERHKVLIKRTPEIQYH